MLVAPAFDTVDTDIVWFQNPLPLMAAMESDFVVQSNAPRPEEEAANGPLRINSGFYRVRATPIGIAAMQQVTRLTASCSVASDCTVLWLYSATCFLLLNSHAELIQIITSDAIAVGALAVI